MNVENDIYSLDITNAIGSATFLLRHIRIQYGVEYTCKCGISWNGEQRSFN